jgi:hypothetical protein
MVLVSHGITDSEAGPSEMFSITIMRDHEEKKKGLKWYWIALAVVIISYLEYLKRQKKKREQAELEEARRIIEMGAPINNNNH